MKFIQLYPENKLLHKDWGKMLINISKKKKICCKIKKVSCYMKCVQGLSESAEYLFSRINKTFTRLSRSIFKKKTTNDFILICYVGNWKFNLLTTQGILKYGH